MVKYIKQDDFERAPFGSTGFNLHRHGSARSATLVIFIHGLNGSGYGTWKDFPSYLFKDGSRALYDVAIFEYASLFKRFTKQGGASMEFNAAQLLQSIKEVQSDYNSIYLVGHSLGGVLAEKVAADYLRDYLMDSPVRPTAALAASALFAAPRAGSRLAISLLRGMVTEFKWLRRESPSSVDGDAFFATNVECHNVATSPRRVIFPRFACIAGHDLAVRRFSAGFGIPLPQQYLLSESHTSVVKPSPERDQAVTWLRRIISEVNEVREQSAREWLHAQARKNHQRTLPKQRVLSTEFWGDPQNDTWERIYNSARKSASTEQVSVQDHRDAPGQSVDLLLSVSSAQSVLDPDAHEKHRVLSAISRRIQSPMLSVGISAVGSVHAEAQARLNQWVLERGHLSSVYVDSAPDNESLRAILARWLELIVGRVQPVVTGDTTRLTDDS